MFGEQDNWLKETTFCCCKLSPCYPTVVIRERGSVGWRYGMLVEIRHASVKRDPCFLGGVPKLKKPLHEGVPTYSRTVGGSC